MLIDRSQFSVCVAESIEAALLSIESCQIHYVVVNWFCPDLCQDALELAFKVRQCGSKTTIVFTMERPTIMGVRLSEIFKPMKVITLPKSKQDFTKALKSINDKELITSSFDVDDTLSRFRSAMEEEGSDRLLRALSYSDMLKLIRLGVLTEQEQYVLLRVCNQVCPFDLWVLMSLIQGNVLTRSSERDAIDRFCSTLPRSVRDYQEKVLSMRNAYYRSYK